MNILIPLIIFLVLLALGQVFNREATAPVRRPGSGGGALGPRPSVGGSPWSTPPRDEYRGRVQVEPERPHRQPSDSGILILGRNVSAPSGLVLDDGLGETQPGRKGRRRGGRGQQPASRRQEKPAAGTSPSLLQGTTAVDLTASHLEKAPSTAAASSQAPMPSVTAEVLAQILRDPARVREAIVLNLVLQPPPGARRVARLARQSK